MSSRLKTGLRILLLFGGVLFACDLRGETADGAASAVHWLTHGKLAAEVMDPNHPQRYNQGVRFTPVAAVLRVWLDGHSYLHAPEIHDPVIDHGGLAAEFDLCKPDGPDADFPPGLREAAVGEGFVKIGVGVLAKGADRYSLNQQWPVLAPAVTQVQWSRDCAVYSQECAGTNGYAYKLEAVVILEDARIVVDWRLTNTGKKPFSTKQYTHNFLCFDNQDTSSGYVLAFPYDFAASGLASGQVQKEREIRFVGPIQHHINANVPWPPGYHGVNCFLLRNDRTGQAVRCETSLPGLFTAIHARPGYISPEQFILLAVEPGKTLSWRRTYDFELASPPPEHPVSDAPGKNSEHHP